MLQHPPVRSRSQCGSAVCQTFLYSLSYSLVSLLYQEITNLHLHGDSDSPHSQKLVFWQPKFSLFIISFHYLLKSIMMYYSFCFIIPYLNSKKGTLQCSTVLTQQLSWHSKLAMEAQKFSWESAFQIFLSCTSQSPKWMTGCWKGNVVLRVTTVPSLWAIYHALEDCCVGTLATASLSWSC